MPCASEPLSSLVADELGKALCTSASKVIHGTIPENLLHLAWYVSKPILVWWTPAQSVPMLYLDNLLKTNIHKMNVPALVWKWDSANQELHIFALKESKRPTTDTTLYNAPFHNVYSDNSVCIGTGRSHVKNLDTFEQTMKMIEDIFWKTKFSELHNEKAVKGNIISLHTELLNTGKPFPVDRLVDSKNILESILD